MTISSSTFVRDTLFFIKNTLSTNVTDPISSSRPKTSGWVMTSYPQRESIYPLITLKVTNYTAKRAGMQTTNMDLNMKIQVRIWARNVKERDTLFNSVLNQLQSIQFTATTGSTANGIHDFNLNSAVDVDEEEVKSKVMEVSYNFFEL